VPPDLDHCSLFRVHCSLFTFQDRARVPPHVGRTHPGRINRPFRCEFTPGVGRIPDDHTPRDHQTSKARALAPLAHAHHVCLAILHVYDASVTLRSPRHAHAMMRELREREAVLRTRDDFARKSVKAPSLRTTGVSIASEPPLYTHLQLWSCSVALRPLPTWLSLMRVRAAVLRRKPPLRQNRQPRHPCAPHVYSGRQHSGSSPTQTLGHAPLPPEHEIVIFAPAAPKLKVVRSPSTSRPAIRTGSPRFVARSDSHCAPLPAPLTTLGASVMLGFLSVPVYTFRPLWSPAAPPPAWQPVTAKTNLRAGGVLRDPNVLFVVSLAALAHRRIPDHAKRASRIPTSCRCSHKFVPRSSLPNAARL